MKNRTVTLAISIVLLVTLALIARTPLNWAQMTDSAPLPEKPTLFGSRHERTPAPVLDADLIRVGISSDSMTELEYPSATISATGPFTIEGKTSGTPIYKGAPNGNIRVSKSADGFHLSSTGGAYNEPLVVRMVNPEADRLKVTSVTRKGKIPSYRGIFELIPGFSNAGRFTVVNVLPMQDYLKAVVPNELPPSYGYEAVKAQSVAARNYALHPREKPWPQFDICDSQYCQAYYGSSTELPATNKALQETQGLIALYQGDPILALYSSSHGGYQESYENAFSDPKTNKFPATPIPYLRGGPDRGETQDLTNERGARAFYSHKDPSSFDILSPLYRWEKTWSRQELEQTINRYLAECSEDKLTSPFVTPAFHRGQSIGTLIKLNPVQRGVSGKVMALQIQGTRGTWTIEKEFTIRKVIQNGGRFLPSANVVFDNLTDKNGNLIAVKATGGGFGHGVGMSQLGASYMSRSGKSFAEIIQHYYKGVAIGTVPLLAKPTQGMKTDFYAPHAQGTLHVTGTAPEVQVTVNNQPLTVKPRDNEQTTVDVGKYLKADELNELKVLPLGESDGISRAKVWIEVIEPHSEG